MADPSDQPAPSHEARGVELEEYCLTMVRVMRRRRNGLALIAVVAGAFLGLL